MAIGYSDIPADEITKAAEATQKKVGTCRVLPRSRFTLYGDGRYVFNGLVCSPEEMGGEATGVAAELCENCIKKRDGA